MNCSVTAAASGCGGCGMQLWLLMAAAMAAASRHRGSGGDGGSSARQLQQRPACIQLTHLTCACKGACDRRGSLGLWSPHLIDYSVHGGGEAVLATTLSFWAASGTQQRSRSVRLRLRPTHTATLSNATVLPHLIVAMFRSRCRSRSRRAPHASL